MKKLICLLVLVMLVSGCATFNSQMYPLKETFAPTDPEKIQVFKNRPPIAHIPIGEVETRAAPASRTSSIYNQFKKDAAKMGGDAVVIVSEGTEYLGTYNQPTTSTTYGSGQVYGNSVSYSGTTYGSGGYSTPIMKKKIYGVVIKYTEKVAAPK